MYHPFENVFFTLQGADFLIGFFLYFTIWCMFGWFIELLYLATSGRGLINSGFLQGPFCPAYASGACIIYLLAQLLSGFALPFWLQILIFGLMCSVIEYLASYFLEKALKLRIWDYSDEPLNINGRISIKYGLFWFVLVGFGMIIIQPGFVHLIEGLPTVTRNAIFTFLIILIPLDYIASAIIFGRLSGAVKKLCAKMGLPINELHDLQFNRPRIMKERKRLAKMFRDPAYAELNNLVKQKLFVDELLETDADFQLAIQDLLDHPKIQAWRDESDRSHLMYCQHLRIAELSWRFCQAMNLDATSAARGAILCAYRPSELGKRRTVANVLFPQWTVHRWVRQEILTPTNKERDIIVRYKWPLNFAAPRGLEGLMVSFADKIIKCKEFRRVVQTLYPQVLN